MKKANPERRTGFDDNISNSAENTPISNEKARQYGLNMAQLYRSNMGSLDAFYKLLATIETMLKGETRQSFLDSFFDAVIDTDPEGSDGNR